MWLGNTRTHACFYAQGRRSRGGSAADRDDRTVQERDGCGSSSASCRRRNTVIVVFCESATTCEDFEVLNHPTHLDTLYMRGLSCQLSPSCLREDRRRQKWGT